MCAHVCVCVKCPNVNLLGFFSTTQDWNSNADMLALSNVDIANLLASNLFARPEEQEQLSKLLGVEFVSI